MPAGPQPTVDGVREAGAGAEKPRPPWRISLSATIPQLGDCRDHHHRGSLSAAADNTGLSDLQTLAGQRHVDRGAHLLWRKYPDNSPITSVAALRQGGAVRQASHDGPRSMAETDRKDRESGHSQGNGDIGRLPRQAMPIQRAQEEMEQADSHLSSPKAGSRRPSSVATQRHPGRQGEERADLQRSTPKVGRRRMSATAFERHPGRQREEQAGLQQAILRVERRRTSAITTERHPGQSREEQAETLQSTPETESTRLSFAATERHPGHEGEDPANPQRSSPRAESRRWPSKPTQRLPGQEQEDVHLRQSIPMAPSRCSSPVRTPRHPGQQLQEELEEEDDPDWRQSTPEAATGRPASPAKQVRPGLQRKEKAECRLFTCAPVHGCTPKSESTHLPFLDTQHRLAEQGHIPQAASPGAWGSNSVVGKSGPPVDSPKDARQPTTHTRTAGRMSQAVTQAPGRGFPTSRRYSAPTRYAGAGANRLDGVQFCEHGVELRPLGPYSHVEIPSGGPVAECWPENGNAMDGADGLGLDSHEIGAQPLEPDDSRDPSIAFSGPAEVPVSPPVPQAATKAVGGHLALQGSLPLELLCRPPPGSKPSSRGHSPRHSVEEVVQEPVQVEVSDVTSPGVMHQGSDQNSAEGVTFDSEVPFPTEVQPGDVPTPGGRGPMVDAWDQQQHAAEVARGQGGGSDDGGSRGEGVQAMMSNSSFMVMPASARGTDLGMAEVSHKRDSLGSPTPWHVVADSSHSPVSNSITDAFTERFWLALGRHDEGIGQDHVCHPVDHSSSSTVPVGPVGGRTFFPSAHMGNTTELNQGSPVIRTPIRTSSNINLLKSVPKLDEDSRGSSGQAPPAGVVASKRCDSESNEDLVVQPDSHAEVSQRHGTSLGHTSAEVELVQERDLEISGCQVEPGALKFASETETAGGSDYNATAFQTEQTRKRHGGSLIGRWPRGCTIN
eukprot:jgi/Botrbrau1/1762/Bobra.0217s0017.1